MHCVHDNPLTCSCANKCSVVVSDFDAAVELDSSDHLQPIQPSSSQRQEPLLQRDVFLVVPVGTLGFRAPECSMLSVSNSIGVIDPPLTTKADIWSFGMFLLRLLIGSEGPCSQREASYSALKLSLLVHIYYMCMYMFHIYYMCMYMSLIHCIYSVLCRLQCYCCTTTARESRAEVATTQHLLSL